MQHVKQKKSIPVVKQIQPEQPVNQAAQSYTDNTNNTINTAKEHIVVKGIYELPNLQADIENISTFSMWLTQQNSTLLHLVTTYQLPVIKEVIQACEALSVYNQHMINLSKHVLQLSGDTTANADVSQYTTTAVVL